MEITSTIFTGNRAKYSGGGACVLDIDKLFTSYTLFSQNEAWNGGGMYVTTSKATLSTNFSYLIQDSIFYRNTASDGVAFYFVGISRDGSFMDTSEISLVHCTIWDNYEVENEYGSVLKYSFRYSVTVLMS